MNQQLVKERLKEIVVLPKLDRSIERLLSKYQGVVTCEHFSDINELLSFIEKSTEEGNDILIQQEYLGFCVSIWKTTLSSLFIGKGG